MSEQNDLIYGIHPVEEALRNPRRRFVSLTACHSPEASGVLFKSASGAYEHVPFVKVTNLARAMDELKEYGFRIAGLDSEASEVIGAFDSAPPIALVLGAEGKGLRQLTRQT